MTLRELRASLQDILDAAASVQSIVRDVTFDRYTTDRPIRSAVEREFTIIGEALRNLIRLDPAVEQRITAAGDIIAFRNHLVHGYFLIADATVWGIITDHLPRLVAEIGALAKEREVS